MGEDNDYKMGLEVQFGPGYKFKSFLVSLLLFFYMFCFAFLLFFFRVIIWIKQLSGYLSVEKASLANIMELNLILTRS